MYSSVVHVNVCILYVSGVCDSRWGGGGGGLGGLVCFECLHMFDV